MNNQLTHRTTPFPKREFPIVLICDGVQGPANIGALFRVCDAFGVSELLFSQAIVNTESSRMRKTARDTYKRVNWSQVEDAASAIRRFREAGYQIVALEITSNSHKLSHFKWSAGDKLALLVGNEQHGISEALLELADQTLHIELYGVNSSINVSHATAIALYQLTHYS